jgi:hypothetical protein
MPLHILHYPFQFICMRTYNHVNMACHYAPTVYFQAFILYVILPTVKQYFFVFFSYKKIYQQTTAKVIKYSLSLSLNLHLRLKVLLLMYDFKSMVQEVCAAKPDCILAQLGESPGTYSLHYCRLIKSAKAANTVKDEVSKVK